MADNTSGYKKLTFLCLGETANGSEEVNAESVEHLGIKMVGAPYEGVAVIPMIGVIGWSERTNGVPARTTSEVIERAMKDPSVKSIVLRFNSPGGEVMASWKIASMVKQAASIKPVYAYVDGLATSGAMLISSQATAIYGQKMAQVGSIGVISTFMDESGFLEKMGVRMEILTTGKYKAIGTKLPLSETERKWVEGRMQYILSQFMSDVAEGRGITEKSIAKNAGDGRVLFAEDAVSAGLMDGIEEFENTLDRAVRAAAQGDSITPKTPRQEAARKRGNSMSNVSQCFTALVRGEDHPEDATEADVQLAQRMFDEAKEGLTEQPEEEVGEPEAAPAPSKGLSAEDVKAIVAEAMAAAQPQEEDSEEVEESEALPVDVEAVRKEERDRCVAILGAASSMKMKYHDDAVLTVLTSDCSLAEATQKITEAAAEKYGPVGVPESSGITDPDTVDGVQQKVNEGFDKVRALVNDGMNYDAAVRQVFPNDPMRGGK